MAGEELIEGALVEWTQGDGYGVIIKVEPAQIRVLWDSPGEKPTQFVRKNAPLQRAALPPQVRRRSNDEVGLLLAPVAGDAHPRWRVQFVAGQKVVSEADLRPDDAIDPGQRLANGQVGSTKRYNLALVTRYYRLEHLHNDLVSLGDARVDIKPHQVGVVHRAVTGYPHRFLLCDEVGLGKTIEAGMILKELRARKQASRTLIIVPPNLARQWQFELKSKFNETFSILNSDTVRHLRAQGDEGNPFARFDSVIVSSSWVTGDAWSKLVAEVDWDMVIVDEAHHARSRQFGNKTTTTQLYRLVQRLAAPEHFARRAVLFLTATPMQLETHELYSLVEMLDPALFPTEEHFEQNRLEMPGLNRLVEQLQKNGFPIPDEDPAETIELVAEWLEIDEDLAEKRLLGDEAEISTLCDDLAGKHLLSEILIRNRKAVVGGFMPRKAHRWEVTLSKAEREALDAVEDYVRWGFNQSSLLHENATGFVMVIFQKLMASSVFALRESLDRRRERLLAGKKGKRPKEQSLEDELDEDAKAATIVAEVPALDRAEADELADLVAKLDALAVTTGDVVPVGLVWGESLMW